MQYLQNGKRIKRTFVDSEGTTHLVRVLDGWTDEQKATEGITVEAEKPRLTGNDHIFYESIDENGVKKERILEDRPEFEPDGTTPIIDPETGQQLITKGLKSTLIEKVKRQAGDMLADLDKYWRIEATTGEKIPPQIKGFDAAIRKRSADIQAAIAACSSVDELIALHTTPTDAQGNPTGNPPITDWPKETDTFDYVPAVVSMRQATIALEDAGLLDSVEAAVAALPKRQQIEWNKADKVYRDNALIATMATQLGLTEAQIDDLFKAADAV